MDPETDILREHRQRKKTRYLMIGLTCGIQKEIIQVNIFTKLRQTHIHNFAQLRLLSSHSAANL